MEGGDPVAVSRPDHHIACGGGSNRQQWYEQLGFGKQDVSIFMRHQNPDKNGSRCSSLKDSSCHR